MKVKIIILQAFLLAQYNCAPPNLTCADCPANYNKMCIPGGNKGFKGNCCRIFDTSPECQDNQYGTPYNKCTPDTLITMGELWYSYCPRPAKSNCGPISRSIDGVKPFSIRQDDLSIFDRNSMDYCYYEIKINSQKIKPMDNSKAMKISIRINAADNMNVFIYKGNDRTKLKQKSMNDGKYTTSKTFEIDASQGAMVLAYPEKLPGSLGVSGAKGSINIMYVCTNCQPVKLMNFGGWQPAIVINALIIIVAIMWCSFVRCGKQKRGRDQVYSETFGETEITLVETKTKKNYLLHNSRVEIPVNKNKLFNEELTRSQYERRMPGKPGTNDNSKIDLQLLEYNMTQNNPNMVTQHTGAADNTSSQIDLARDFNAYADMATSSPSRQDVNFSKIREEAKNLPSPQQADVFSNDKEQGQQQDFGSGGRPRKDSKFKRYQNKKKEDQERKVAIDDINQDIDQYESELNNIAQNGQSSQK